MEGADGGEGKGEGPAIGRAREFCREFQRETIARADRFFPEGGGGYRRMRGKLDVRIRRLKLEDKLISTEMSNIFDPEMRGRNRR
jgi:hypothetical protein